MGLLQKIRLIIVMLPVIILAFAAMLCFLVAEYEQQKAYRRRIRTLKHGPD